MQAAFLALAATLLLQLGYFMWKVAVDRLASFDRPTSRSAPLSLLLDGRWLLGLLMVVLGWLLFVQATAYGELSLIQPLMSAGDVLLVLLSVVVLHERLSRLEALGVLITIGGAVLLATGAMHVEARLYDTQALLALLSVSTVTVAAAGWRSRRGTNAEIALAIAVGTLFGTGAMLTKLMSVQQNALGLPILSIQTATNPVLLGVVATNVLGLVLLQVAFKTGRASVVVPVQLAAASVLAVVGGLSVFNEDVTPVRTGGVLGILLGTALLHTEQRKRQAQVSTPSSTQR